MYFVLHHWMVSSLVISLIRWGCQSGEQYSRLAQGVENEKEPFGVLTWAAIVRSHWVDHPGIPVLKVYLCRLMFGAFGLFQPFLKVEDDSKLYQTHFHAPSIEASPVTIACKMAKLFTLFHWSTQRERTLVHPITQHCSSSPSHRQPKWNGFQEACHSLLPLGTNEC